MESNPSARLLRTATLLVALTLVYNLIEAVIAIASGVVAESIALLGFGLDSVIEMAASAVMLSHLLWEGRHRDHEASRASEERVRKFIGITFLLLAGYILVESGRDLFSRHVPEESLVGIILAVASLIIMPLIAIGKLRIAKKLNNAALRAEAKETLACAYLSLALLLGLLFNSTLGWWWADPVAALAMIPWLIREGLEAIRGDEEEE